MFHQLAHALLSPSATMDREKMDCRAIFSAMVMDGSALTWANRQVDSVRFAISSPSRAVPLCLPSRQSNL